MEVDVFLFADILLFHTVFEDVYGTLLRLFSGYNIQEHYLFCTKNNCKAVKRSHKGVVVEKFANFCMSPI